MMMMMMMMMMMTMSTQTSNIHWKPLHRRPCSDFMDMLRLLTNCRFIVICPMRQQHWTDYKISLCVCQWVSQWVSDSV